MSLGILIGVPSNGRKVQTEWAMGFVSQMYPPGTCVEYVVMRKTDLCEARNQLVKMALKNKRKYIWFVDDDIILPGSCFVRLLHAIENYPNAGAIGGIYVTKTDPAWPLIFERLGDTPMVRFKLGHVFPVEGIGTGCMLIKTEVFSKLPEPWFEFACQIPKDGENWSTDQDNPSACGSMFLGEDLGFCKKLNGIDYKVLAHGGILCGHIDDEGLIYGLNAEPLENQTPVAVPA